MKDQDLVNALREHAEWAAGNEWETPLMLGDDLTAAADRIANQNTHIAALQKAVEDLRAQLPRWIPVTERLPEKQAWYHVAIRDKKTMRVSVEQDLYAVETAKNFGHEIGFCKANRWPEREELIAWMQFPSAPDAPEEGDKA